MKALAILLLAAALLTPGAWAGDTAIAPAPARMDPEADAADAADARVPVLDPWEGFNRSIHSFNNAADSLVLRPLAVGYDKAVPDAVKAGVSRFFSNLGMPVTVANQALQGRPAHAVQSLGRFAANSTIGIAGVFDPASHLGLPKRHDEDFGQTLATWGWRDSRYLVVPLFGPRTVRDLVAMLGDQPLSPLGQIESSSTVAALQMMEIVDGRVQMLPLDKFRRDAMDDYLLVRDAWSQQRNHQIDRDLENQPD